MMDRAMSSIFTVRVQGYVDTLNFRDVETVDFNGFSADCVCCTWLDPGTLSTFTFFFGLSFFPFRPFRVVLEAYLC